MVALDKRDGTMLWQFQTDAGVNGTATTFMHEGAQYMAIISAGSLYSNGAHGDSVWLFSLNGTMASLTTAQTAANSAASAQAAATATAAVEPVAGYTANLDSGRQIYTTLCTTCHGETGEGGHQGGAPLKGKELSLGHIMTMASFGKNTMPGFANVYSKEQLQDVATFIREELLKQ